MLKHSIVFCCGALLGITLMTTALSAASLDGTSSVIFKEDHHVFRNGEQAKGFVYFDDGFTVLNNATATINCLYPIAGSIDLRGTGNLVLDGDLALDNQCTITQGGYVSSDGSTLALYSNVTIPQGVVMHCTGDIIINGHGNTLHLEPDTQLFLDNNSTLTLKNMILTIDRSYPGQPALHVSTSLSKLCLDNVVLNLGNDLYLNKGQFFFHNDVVVTGTSALVYTSPASSFVASGSSLYFDYGTTFSYAPCTPSGNLLKLVDETSSLFFDGATLKTTATGMQLTKGSVYFDDLVSLEQRDYGMTLNSTAVDSLGNYPQCLACSPNNKYVVAGFYSGSNDLKLYSFSNGNLQLVQTINTSYVGSLSWSPDGRYLVIGRIFNNYAALYSFINGQLQYVQNIEFYKVVSLSWSPDGKYLTVGTENGSNDLKLYVFSNGQLQFVQEINVQKIYSASWSSDGKYVTVGQIITSSSLVLYALVDGQLNEVQVINDTNMVRSLSWSPNGEYLAAGLYDTSNGLKMYRFSNGLLQQIQQINLSYIRFVAWSLDGKYLTVGREVSDSNALKLFLFANELLHEKQTISSVSIIRLGAWSLDQKYMLIKVENTVFIYESLFTSQAPRRPIEFGDGANASNNCSVNFLSNARVVVGGNVVYNAV